MNLTNISNTPNKTFKTEHDREVILKNKTIELSKKNIEYLDFIDTEGILLVFHQSNNSNKRETARTKFGREIVCTDLAFHFLKLRNCSNFANKTWLEESLELKNNIYCIEHYMLRADRYIFISDYNKIGDYLFNIASDIKTCCRKSILFNTTLHSMAIDLELDRSGIIVLKFYDSNLRDDYIEIFTLSMSALKNLKINYFLDKNSINTYCPGIYTHGVFFIYNNFESLKQRSCNTLELLGAKVKLTPYLLCYSILCNDAQKVRTIMRQLASIKDGNILLDFFKTLVNHSYYKEPILNWSIQGDSIESANELIKGVTTKQLRVFLCNDYSYDLFKDLFRYKKPDTLRLFLRQLKKLQFTFSELIDFLKQDGKLFEEILCEYILNGQEMPNIFFEEIHNLGLSKENILDENQIKAIDVLSNQRVLKILNNMRRMELYSLDSDIDVFFIEENVFLKESLNLYGLKKNTLFLSKKRQYFLNYTEKKLMCFNTDEYEDVSISKNSIVSSNQIKINQYVFLTIFLSALLYYYINL